MPRSFDTVELTLEFVLRLFTLMREGGVKLGTQQTICCTRAIALRAVRTPELLRRVCRVTLVNRKQDLPELERLFALLLAAYLNPDSDDGAGEQRSETFQLQVSSRAYLGDASEDDEESNATAGYSARVIDHREDFRRMPRQDFPMALRSLEAVARQHAAIPRRKFKPSKRGRIVDFHASLRESRKYGGELVALRFKNKTPTRTRLLVLVDISGSMEVYGVFLLNFLYALQRNRWLSLEVFAFSTELQPLTSHFRMRNFSALLEALSGHVAGWSGGTRIGYALRCLNETHVASVSGKTVVTIMSDGWDTGDIALLDREMARLARRAKAIVWMNPLKGDPRYQPLAQGMATARPYCDTFISGHNIDSFKQFVNVVAR